MKSVEKMKVISAIAAMLAAMVAFGVADHSIAESPRLAGETDGE